jgi:hypothetical protein
MAIDPDLPTGPLPFTRYRGQGRLLVGPPTWGDGTARHGYGLPVFAQCGYCCAYCGLDMLASFEAWLQLSVDHVVPRNSISLGFRKDWIEDVANLVTCCGPCSALGNRFTVDVEAPSTLEAFFELRDRAFRERRALILDRRSVERAHYQAQLRSARG